MSHPDCWHCGGRWRTNIGMRHEGWCPVGSGKHVEDAIARHPASGTKRPPREVWHTGPNHCPDCAGIEEDF